MTKAVRDRILKDSNADISDHLRNHIHLTNCIHLKNHMHKQSPILTDRSLMRDLIVLQRSRSLRDPSASPPSWQSPSVHENNPPPQPRDHPSRRDSNPSRVAPGEVSSSAAAAGGRRARNSNADETKSGNSGSKSRSSINTRKKKGKEKVPPAAAMMMMKTLSEQLDNDSEGSGGAAVSSTVLRLHQRRQEAPAKRKKFRRARRNNQQQTHRGSMALGPAGDVHTADDVTAEQEQNELSVASNNLCLDEYGGGARGPGNGCGIPWNWSRIHHRGKTFFDMAGRSLSCGLSDPRLKKAGHAEPPPEDGGSSSSSPLLVVDGGSGSAESSGEINNNAAWARRRYSGELDIYAVDSDLASVARSGDRHKSKGRSRSRSRHQNLTQKYAPQTFRDLVGQNLVVQALSNAVTKRKVGLLYVFYGPHGTGKTSCARIFARALNCQSLEHPKPCGFCNSCKSHDSGKSRNIREVGPVSNFDFERIMDLLDNMAVAQLPSHYNRVTFIFDDCDALSSECWGAISKVIDRAPRRVVFVLVCSSLDALPHVIISRCQKFFFPKLKDAEIIYTLQWIASKEGLEIDRDALRLIASRSDGSLRDAEMTLEQLSLLGQRISVPLVQELVGLISDEKLVDLLDLALSADTVNTVKNLRVIMETGVEPLGLMSQLATIITDILAGSYDYTRDRPRRKFFRRHPLSKEDMEKLRQALKTLSEAEKQLRTSNDKLTWLTAALLQLAPDNQYLLPSSSADTSFDQSPLALLNNDHGRTNHRQSGLVNDGGLDRQRHQQVSGRSSDPVRAHGKQVPGKTRKGVEEIWLEVLEKIQYNGVKEFLYQEGKLVSVTFGAAPTVQLMFSSHLTKSTAEKFRGHILQAFESVLRSPVTIEIRCEKPKRESRDGQSQSRSEIPILPSNNNNARGTSKKSEIVEIEASPKEAKANKEMEDSLHKKSASQNSCQSIVRSKVSLAHVIQQVEGSSQHNGWSKRKAVSIAEKLEQENLRLEPRSRSLLCWKATRVTRRKLSRLKIRARKPRSLLKYVSCGKCLSTKSPR